MCDPDSDGQVFRSATDRPDMDDPAEDLTGTSRFRATTVHRDRASDRRELLLGQMEQVHHQGTPTDRDVGLNLKRRPKITALPRFSWKPSPRAMSLIDARYK